MDSREELVKDGKTLATWASFESNGDTGRVPCFVMASWVLLGRQTVGPLSIVKRKEDGEEDRVLGALEETTGHIELR